MLSVTGLKVMYGSIAALRGVSIEIGEGEIVAVLGPNGAGKTTLLHSIMGTVYAHEGKILFNGMDITHVPTHQVVEMGITIAPEGRMLFPEMSVLENLDLGRYVHADNARPLQSVFELFPVLRDRLGQMAGTLSSGEQQMLAIARALMGNPKLLLLDEPSLGLAPVVASKVFGTIAKISNGELSILLVEQNVARAVRIARRVYVLVNGRIELECPADKLFGYEQIRQFYLGV